MCRITSRLSRFRVWAGLLHGRGLKLIWGHFVRYLRLAGVDFQYVSVLERHPTNPDHLHMHVAWRGEGFVNYNMLRRFWHMAIGKRAGVVVKKVLRGPDSLGNVQDRQIKASAGSYRHTEKIAKYIGKYITKDLISEFNKNATGSPPAYRLRRRRCTGCLLCRCLRL